MVTFLFIGFLSLGVWLVPRIINFESYGNWTGKTSINLNDDYTFYTTTYGDNLTKTNLKNKIIILDFWTTSCGWCYKLFPQVEKMHKDLEGNKNIKLYSINVPLPRDSTRQPFKELRELGYTFPIVKSPLKQTIDVFNIHAYPAVLMIKKGTEVIYNGSFENLNIADLEEEASDN